MSTLDTFQEVLFMCENISLHVKFHIFLMLPYERTKCELYDISRAIITP